MSAATALKRSLKVHFLRFSATSQAVRNRPQKSSIVKRFLDRPIQAEERRNGLLTI